MRQWLLSVTCCVGDQGRVCVCLPWGWGESPAGASENASLVEGKVEEVQLGVTSMEVR